MITFEIPAVFAPATVAPAVPGGRVDLLRDVTGVYVKRDDKHIGAMAVAMADDGFGRDLFIRALAGRDPDLVKSADQYVRAAVIAGGFDGARAFTLRPGAMRHFERLGWAEIGRYYRLVP